mgnify:CR=1 FL=1
MRKLIAALSAAGLGLTTFAATAPTTGAAPPPGVTVTAAPTPSDELPNPLEDKRRDLRQTALEQVLAGTAQTEQVNGSTVVKVGSTAGPAPSAGTTQRRSPRSITVAPIMCRPSPHGTT